MSPPWVVVRFVGPTTEDSEPAFIVAKAVRAYLPEVVASSAREDF